MDGFVKFCVQHRFLVIFGVLLIGALGVSAAQQLPIDAVPDVTNVQVQVLTNAPALGPVEVEQYVTVPVETVMSGLPHVEEVRSLSRFGLSAVTVVFEEDTDIYFARQMVSERLSEAREAIPEGYGSPEMGPISTGLGEIYQFEVRGDPMCPSEGPDTDECYSLMELRTILDWYVAFQLRPIPGVVEVNPFGGELKTYEVQVDPARLNGLGLSLGDVFEALEQNNANEGGGYIVRGGEQRVIRGEGLIASLDDVRLVRVATRNDGTPIFVRDVASVAFAPMVRQGAVTRDGRGEVVTASVMMLMGANSGDVSRAVRERLDEIAPGLPPGVTIETYYDRSVLVDRTIRTVAVNLIEGGILVIVVLLLMLGNLRGGLLVAAVIPLSLLVTFISMRFFGVSGNLMSLGALDFGLIIDGAIVVIENVSRRLSESGVKGAAVKREVRRATTQVIRPVLFGTRDHHDRLHPDPLPPGDRGEDVPADGHRRALGTRRGARARDHPHPCGVDLDLSRWVVGEGVHRRPSRPPSVRAGPQARPPVSCTGRLSGSRGDGGRRLACDDDGCRVHPDPRRRGHRHAGCAATVSVA